MSRPRGRTRVTARRGLAIIVFIALLAATDTAALPEAPPPPKIHTLFVSADDPSAWPEGLEPIPAAELLKLLGRVDGRRVKPAGPRIERAVYQAKFRGDRLVEGNARFDLFPGAGPAATLVPLGETTLELANPRWVSGGDSAAAGAKTENALWGSDAAGKRVLIVEKGQSRLVCDWSLGGQSLLSAFDFTLVLPPALVSQVVLTLPALWTLDATTGVVSNPVPSPGGGDLVWQIDLGSQSSCRLRIDRKPSATARSAVYYDQDTGYVVSAEQLQIQSKLALDVFSGPLASFSLAVPRGVRVETITCADVPLAFRTHARNDVEEIDVSLPEPLTGKGRSIVVEASTASRLNQVWNLPRVDFPGSVRREGQVELRVVGPLKLLQFGPETGLAQLEAPSYAANGEETFRLRDSDPRTPISIRVGEPAPILTVSMLTRLDLLRDQSLLRCDVVCAASGGSTFAVECELPAAWDVTNVQAVGDVSRIVHWASHPASAHKRRIKIDFSRAVTEREPQRFRIDAAGPAPRTGDRIELPVLTFPGPRTGNLQTVVTHSPAIDLALDPPTEFVPIGQAVVPAPFGDSPLLPDPRAWSEERIVVHQRTMPNEKAGITLRRGEQGFMARVQTTVDLRASQMTERIAASVTPQAGPLDRLFVYLTAEGPPLSWLLASDRPRPLEASRIPAGRHSEWNLPVGGELWEIRLPDPQRRPFRLEGQRKTNGFQGGGIGLAFLPGARSFSGTVDVRLEDARLFDVEALGPQTLRPSDDRLPADARADNRVVRSWGYERPTDSLVIKPRPSGSPEAALQVALLDLHSYLYAGGTGDDLHKAIFSLAPLPGTRPFRFSLDSTARLNSVTVNGRIVRVQHHDDAVTVPSLPSDRWNRVEIVYQTASAKERFRETRPVVVPQAADAAIFQFRWWFALPPGVLPGGDPAGTRLSERLSPLSWSEKLFGPLGRPTSERQIPSFTEAPWMTDFGFESDTRPDVFAEIDPERPAPDWSVWHATAQTAPASLTLALWHEREMRGLAWIVFLGCLSIGFVLAAWRNRWLKSVQLAIVAVAAALSLVAPGLDSLPLGACVSGTLLSFLVAGVWFAERARSAAPSDKSSRPGSTLIFRYGSIVLLLAIGALCVAAARGADSPAEESGLFPDFHPSGPFHAAAPTDLLVVVPISGGTANEAKTLPDDERLLYVPRGSLETLRRMRNQAQQSGDSVFLSADYTLAFDGRQLPLFEARYRVAVISAHTTSLPLPLSDVTLAGVDACRVNGIPCPVRKTDDGFVLALTVPGTARENVRNTPPPGVDQRQAVKAERPRPARSGQTTPAAAADSAKIPAAPSPRIFEISLRFFPDGSEATGPARFEIHVPKIAGARLTVRKPGPESPLAVVTDNGRLAILPARSAATIKLDESGLLRLAPAPSASSTAPRLDARAVQLIRVSPELIEMDCRVVYSARPNTLDDLEWMIPAAAVARAPDDTIRIARGTPTADGRWVPLKFAVLTKSEGPLTLGVKLALPVRAIKVLGRPPHFVIPLVRFAAGTSTGSVRLLSNQVGVTTIAGYRASVSTNESNLAHTTAADPAFRQEWHGDVRKEPEFILESHGLSALPVELLPLVPSRKVRISHEARFSAERLAWKTSAEIRVENAPAFLHLLKVDPRLKIESISIQEDNVERLVRYSQSGEDVTLFLRDRAAATQDLVLTGSMPIELGREITLPTVSLVGATVTDLRLLVEPNSQVDVAMRKSAPHDAAAIPEVPSEERAARRAREYVLTPGDPLPLVSVTLRAEQPRLSRVTVVTPRGSNTFDVCIYLLVSGTRGEEGPFEVTIPEELAARSTIVANVDKQIRRHADGTFGMLLESHPATDPVVQIHWTQTPGGQTWSLPSLAVTNAPTSDSVLLVSQSIAWRPRSDSRVALRTSAVPTWMDRWLPEAQTFNGWTPAKDEPVDWILTRPSAAPLRRASARVYTSVALSADGSIQGSLFLLVDQQADATRAIRWPVGATLRAALLDGRPVQPLSQKADQLVFPLGTDGRPHRLAIHWASSGRQLGGLAKIVEEIPLPADTATNTMLLEVSVPPSFEMLAPASFHAMGPGLFAGEARTIANVEAPPAGNGAAGPAALPVFASEVGRGLLGRLALTKDLRSIQFWVFRESLITAPLAVLTFAFLFVVLLRLATARRALWLAHHQPAAIAVIGVAWWLCLSPRIAGVVLVVIALTWFALRRRTRRARGQHNLPSTVHIPA